MLLKARIKMRDNAKQILLGQSLIAQIYILCPAGPHTTLTTAGAG
jgi:hypothetical protein